MRPRVTSRLGVLGLATIALLCGAPSPSSAQPSTPAEVGWDQRLGSAARFADFRALALGDDGLFVGGIERASIEPNGPGPVRLLLWALAADGSRRYEVELSEFPEGEKANTRTVRDVEALPGGEALVLVDFVSGRPSLVRVNARGEQASTRRVLPDNRTPTLLQMVPMAGGRHLLIGHERFDALAVMVDASGAPLWDRVFDRGRMDYFLDGVATADGGAVLVGNSGTYDAMRNGESRVWVGRYDATGIAGSEITFVGRYGRLASLADGGVAVVYDRGATLGREVHVKRLGADLREMWDVAIDVTSEGIGDFRIAARADGSLVVAGGSGGLAQLVVVDASGRASAPWTATPGMRAIDVGPYGLVLDRTGDVVLAGSHVQAQSKTNVQYQVRVRRLGEPRAQRGL